MSLVEKQNELSRAQGLGLVVTFMYNGVQRWGHVEAFVTGGVTLRLLQAEGAITSRNRPGQTEFKTFNVGKIEELHVCGEVS